MPASAPSLRKSSAIPAVFWLAVLALLLLRVPHFFGPLDDPNSWRQCDTVHNSLDFFRRGPDILHPAVPWLGAHRTLALDFPITPVLSSFLYHLGGPTPVWDRVVSLVFFLFASWHLYRLLALVAGPRVAQLGTLAFLVFPISVFYSRAPHIEFTVIAGVNGLFYHGLRACAERGWRQPLLAVLWGTLGALVKAPYILTILPPLGLALLGAAGLMPWVRLAFSMAIPAGAFLLWRHHVDAVNATVPNWYFLPDFYKEVNPIWRYTGTFAERMEPGNWTKIARRVVKEVLTYGGVVFAFVAMLNREARGPVAGGEEAATRADESRGVLRLDPRAFALAWALGSAAFVCVFFRLNVFHNYYQTPMLAPAAMWVGLGADLAWRRLPKLGPVPGGAVVFAAFLAYAAWSPATLGYYRVDWLRDEAGHAIEARVPRGDLVVACDHNTLPPTDPRLLYRADREGWPMRIEDLTADRLLKLREFGAKWVVIVTSPDNPSAPPPVFLEPARVARDTIRHHGNAMGELHVYDLSRLAGAPADSSR